ncbi:NtaA/DmoA family FMN-dependent monooxygenase [Pseudonocardia sp. NPDC049635]|uniref:NtaA/DmoA family FMN-dependent monooxygenase n=1 Tax=Pseudonocardia sp. NPDC049635 TaxID=3155506 RepID=UPI003407483C
MFHLGWFLGKGFGVPPFMGLGNVPWGPRRTVFDGRAHHEWMKPDLYVDLVRSLERGGFDFLFMEDSSMVEDSYGGSMELTLKYGLMAPKNDPVPLVPLLTAATKHLGVIPTISTIAYHPYLAARLMTTLDHLSEGRVGLNVVTSVTDRVAQNFGHDQHFDHDLRYEMADEWLDACGQLWESWEPGAVVLDEESGTYADHTKVHPVDFTGKWFRTRGPLNTIPGPQRRPVVAQAGNSIPGRDLAAKYADTLLAHASSVESMKAFRDDIRERAVAHGREPDDVKILYLVTPTVGATDADAAERNRVNRLRAEDPDQIRTRLWSMSYVSGGRVDFSTFDLDGPVPEVVGNGEQSSMAAFVENNRGKTLRQAVVEGTHFGGTLGLSGSPDTVAARMGEIMEEVGGDGFLLYPQPNRRSIAEISDGLCTALRRRGLIRDGYPHATLRENLLDF